MSSSGLFASATEETWAYLPVLNECIKILITISIGSVLQAIGVFEAEAFVPHAVKFVFRVALPLLVVRGIGINTDFYSDKFLWLYILAFLILRAIALFCSFFFALLTRANRKDGGYIGDVAVMWLSLTWISTVILGIPILTSVFGNPTKGGFYGILAGISSFIFQLPLQLFFLECNALEREYRQSMPDVAACCDTRTCPNTNHSAEVKDSRQVHPQDEEAGATASGGKDSCADPQHSAQIFHNPSTIEIWTKAASSGDVWKRIGCRIVKNPVLWGISVGFFLSLSTIGPRFLRPTSEEFVPGLKWINDTLAWFGACVSPVSLFTMGVWMQSKGRKLLTIGPIPILLFMLSKLVVVPLVMVGLAKALSLNNEAGRAAVLIATLPISMMSFTLGSHYKVGEAILSENVAIGTLLMLPTVLIWNIVMDAVSLFPVPE